MRLAGWMFLFALFYYVALLVEPKKIDRYALPMIAPVLLFAAYGFDYLWETVKRNWLRICLVTCGVVQVLLVWKLAPYYQTYENLIGRGLQYTPLRVSQVFNSAWGEGMSQAADFIRQADGTSAPVASWYASDLCVYGLPRDVQTYPLSPTPGLQCPTNIWLLAEPTQATWLILSRDQVSQRLYPKLIDDIHRLGWQPTKTISLNGQPYIWIYKNLGGLQPRYTLSGK